MTFGYDEAQIIRDAVNKAECAFGNVLEIGTNAGHSSALMLELFPAMRVHSCDIHMHDYTDVAVRALKTTYKDRFEYIKGNSTTCSYLTDYYDLALIDGSHLEADCLADIENCIRANIPYLLIDDMNMDGPYQAVKKMKNKLEFIQRWTYNNKYGLTKIEMYEVK